MTSQVYCLINNTNVTVDNIVMWDGDTTAWTPPANYTCILQATTPSREWKWDSNLKDWFLTEPMIGYGGIGFTWDGSVLTTGQPKPPPPPEPVSPTVEGAQTL